MNTAVVEMIMVLIEIWMNSDRFCMTEYTDFGSGRKATRRSPSNKLTQSTITKSKSFSRKGIGKVGRSMREYLYLILTFKFMRD